MTAISRLKALDVLKASPEDVRNILLDNKLAIISYIIHPDVLILRGRRGANYNTRKDMTYCPVQYCQNYQRATLPGETMFYGVISDNQAHQENARAILTAECSELCRGGNSTIGRENFSLSHWSINSPLRVGSFITDMTYLNVNNNSLLNNMRETFIEFHKKGKSTEDIKNLARFISVEFSKQIVSSREYLITSTITSDIVKFMGFDGIVYPSVQLGGQGGLNIALTPTAVDEKLTFIRAFNQTLYKNGSKSFIRIESKYEKGKVNQIRHATDFEIAQSIGLKNIYSLPLIN